MSPQGNILFIPHRSKCIDVFLRVAVELKNRSFEPIFILPGFMDSNQTGNFLSSCGIRYEYVNFPIVFSEPFTFWLRLAFAYRKICIHLLDKYKPVLVVFVDDSSGFRAFLQKIAATKKIKTTVLQWTVESSTKKVDEDYYRSKWLAKYRRSDRLFDKILNSMNLSLLKVWYLKQLKKRFYDNSILKLCGFDFSRDIDCLGGGTSDFFIVVSKHAKEQFASQGIDENKMKVLGTPLFDEYADILGLGKREIDKEMRERLNIDNNKPLITFGTQPLDQKDLLTEQKYIKSVKDIIIQLLEYGDNCNIILKLHPAESPAYYESQLKDLIKYIRITNSVDTKKLIYVSKIYITACSSTATAAIAFGVPVITYNFWDTENFLFSYYKFFGGTLHAESIEEVREFIRKLLCEDKELVLRLKENQAIVKRDKLILDGDCTMRIADFCQGMINGNRSC